MIAFEDKDLGVLYFEVADVAIDTKQGGLAPMTSKDMIGNFDYALKKVRDISQKLISSILDIPERPDEVECKIGFTFNMEAGIFIAKTSTEGNFEITLKWNKKNTANDNPKSDAS